MRLADWEFDEPWKEVWCRVAARTGSIVRGLPGGQDRHAPILLCPRRDPKFDWACRMLDAIIDELIKDSLRKAAAGGDLGPRRSITSGSVLSSGWRMPPSSTAASCRGATPRRSSPSWSPSWTPAPILPRSPPCPSSSRRRRPASRKSIACRRRKPTPSESTSQETSLAAMPLHAPWRQGSVGPTRQCDRSSMPPAPPCCPGSFVALLPLHLASGARLAVLAAHGLGNLTCRLLDSRAAWEFRPLCSWPPRSLGVLGNLSPGFVGRLAPLGPWFQATLEESSPGFRAGPLTLSGLRGGGVVEALRRA